MIFIFILTISFFAYFLHLASYIGISSQYLPYLLIASVLGAISAKKYFVPEIDRQDQQTGRKNNPSNKNSHIELIFVVIISLILLIGLISLLFSVPNQISYHGYFHSAYVYEILKGNIPPQNVTLPGYPANYYWLYHGLLAVISLLLNIPPMLSSTLLNIISLIGILRFIYLFIRRSYPASRLQSFYFSFLILFGSNLLGFFLLFISGGRLLPALGMAITSRIDDRILLGGLISKFLNFNAFPLALLFFFYLINLFSNILNEKIERRHLILFSFLCGGLLYYHATTGLFVMLIIPSSLFITGLLTCTFHLKSLPDIIKNLIIMEKQNFFIYIFIFLGLFATPLSYVYQSSLYLPTPTTILELLDKDIFSIVVSGSVLFPFAAMEAVKSFRFKNVRGIYFSGIVVLGYTLTMFLNFPDYNDYKFIYLSGIALSFLTVGYFFSRQQSKRDNTLAHIIMLLVICSLFYQEARYIHIFLYNSSGFSYTGINVNIPPFNSTAKTYLDSWEWIRKKSDPNSIIIQPIFTKNSNIEYLYQRLPFVVDGDIYNMGFENTKIRINLLTQFYNANEKIENKEQIIRQIIHEMPSASFLLIYPYSLKDNEQIAVKICKQILYRGTSSLVCRPK